MGGGRDIELGQEVEMGTNRVRKTERKSEWVRERKRKRERE